MTISPSPQRIALLTNFIPPYRVPLYRSLARQVQELQIFLSTPMEANRQWPIAWADLAVQVQQSVTAPLVWRHPQGFRETLYVHLPYDTLVRLHRYQPDVVISGELGLRSLQALLYRATHPRSRLILWVTLSEHTEQNRGRGRALLRRLLLTRSDAVVVTGQSGARYVRHFGVLSERVFVVDNPIDAAPWLALDLERTPIQATRLLYVGRLIELKGLDLLFDALHRYAVRKLHGVPELWLAGSGPLEPHLRARAAAAGVACRFLGNVPYALLPQVYAQAGILVFPTLGDNWGLVVNEALAAGMPVLGSRYSQAVEQLIVDGLHGWTFRPDVPAEFDAALDRALHTPPERLQQMRHAVREQIRPLTPEAVAGEFLKAIAYVS